MFQTNDPMNECIPKDEQCSRGCYRIENIGKLTKIKIEY